MSEALLALRPPGGFGLIMADPPWRFATRSPRGVTRKGAGGHYATMSLDAIRALPVSELAARDCLLWLWATNPMLPDALAVMAAWGFTYKTAGHWSKRNPATGKLAFGTGYILRCAGEPFLIGTRGSPRATRGVRSVIEGRAREHSRKPDEAFAAAEALMPGVPRLEMFSRQDRPGWAVFGDEAGRFDAPAAGAKARASRAAPCPAPRFRAGSGTTGTNGARSRDDLPYGARGRK